MKNNNEEKGVINKIKAFCQSKVGKMTLFFGFYFFFFLFLSFFLNANKNIDKSADNNNNNQVVDKENNSQVTDLFTINPIVDNNYFYNYTILENGNEINFTGQINDKNFLIEEYAYNYFLDIYNVRQLIKNSKYISKTDYSDNIVYQYELTNKTINELRGEELNSEGTNKITVTVNSNLVVTDIELDLNNYMSNKFNEYKITLQYGKVANNEKSNTN